MALSAIAIFGIFAAGMLFTFISVDSVLCPLLFEPGYDGLKAIQPSIAKLLGDSESTSTSSNSSSSSTDDPSGSNDTAAEEEGGNVFLKINIGEMLDGCNQSKALMQVIDGEKFGISSAKFKQQVEGAGISDTKDEIANISLPGVQMWDNETSEKVTKMGNAVEVDFTNLTAELDKDVIKPADEAKLDALPNSTAKAAYNEKKAQLETAKTNMNSSIVEYKDRTKSAKKTTEMANEHGNYIQTYADTNFDRLVQRHGVAFVDRLEWYLDNFVDRFVYHVSGSAYYSWL